MFLQVMVLWEVACLQKKKSGSYFFECDEGEAIWVMKKNDSLRKKKKKIQCGASWCWTFMKILQLSNVMNCDSAD